MFPWERDVCYIEVWQRRSWLYYKHNVLTLRTDNFLAALVMDNPVPIKDKYHVCFIAGTASVLRKDEMGSIRGRAASFVWSYTVTTIATYSTLWKRQQALISQVLISLSHELTNLAMSLKQITVNHGMCFIRFVFYR